MRLTAVRLALGPAPSRALVALAAVAFLGGCVATSNADAATSATPPTPGGSAHPVAGDGDDLHYPDGADATTPACQPASAAVVTAVNAAMTPPDYHPEGTPLWVSSLTAAPDPEHAVWLLSGTVRQDSTTDGYVVAWATTADPTLDDFDAPLRSIGYATAAITSAPALQFADGDVAGGLPPAALACAAQSAARVG
ncbi:hypothetical protein N1031_03035 [Herbiconiux moechotypicola]|uniref:Lipoprotein n=1 Tax=Herbiconiux moechotypicola TaxID=637393 RepID=A0ABN3DCI3_9MICO|nr:hypothetical protein [Herbiconiux moechotypicola]MCS5728722.1 hypothetical protein [Herbiconiux moechotypicola]